MTDAQSLDPLHNLVAAMDRLRSPGGCPWDADQTHASLVKHALEETYEFVEAVETGNRAEMREELGDLLFQVVFNARVAQEDPLDPFTLDDVAQDLTAKLIRRHPHVFGDDEYVDDAHLTARWDAIKQQEKHRDSILDGIPLAQGALSRAQKVVTRAERAGIEFDEADVPDADAPDAVGQRIGADLLRLVRRAHAAGVDAEGALRGELRRVEGRIVAAEAGAPRPESGRLPSSY